MVTIDEACRTRQRIDQLHPETKALIEDRRQLAILALQLLTKAIRDYSGTGQRYRLTAFVGCLYNGMRYPFDLSDLRGLDLDVQDACMTVLNFDRLGVQEIHKLGVVTGVQIHSWMVEDGYAREADRRQIGRDLYYHEYGESGHPAHEV